MKTLISKAPIRGAAVVLATIFFANPHFVAAQSYPSRALRLVVPFAPGGSTDTLARIVGQRFTESAGQSVIVDNRPAAG
ncbi:MAG TPA: ABC transporter substrate-binding protein, partial [Burkholderiales bacterium]|nr:ABC transporter substrate-binding protein [Burkholderiales bacterium]